jgi:eukaryotic-like serine/threonine-protein kinase
MHAGGSADSILKSKGKLAKGPPNEELPRAFGRLTLLKQIARGGMGEVFLATSGGIEGAERPCVVKIIRREHAGDRSFLARFLDEARIQAQLQHPGVAQVLEAAIDPAGQPFVVVEYVEGRNLSDVRHRAHQLGVRIGWPEAIAIGIAIADALAHVHERTDAEGRPLSIAHRDLSPQNVMVGYDGDVKLIDFGTARGENRRCHTVAGIVFAKPGYVAPEVANNHPGGAPADVYAFGIMLWELIAGRRFLSGEASEHLAQVAQGQRRPAPLAALNGTPKELDRVIAKLTAQRIEDRYASARAAIADLVGVLKCAPTLADGERGVRARIAHLLERLYPAEPARTRAEFARLVGAARKTERPQPLMPSPSPPPAEPSDPALLAGTRYRLVREIGRGAMGVVYEAYHVDLARTVALKLLPKEHADHPAHRERLSAEARAIARLRHDNLVALHDFGISADGRPFYAMELLEGETLEAYIAREKGMDWRETAELGVQACAALETAHGASVVHRDIKPANLFLTRSGILKLLDFGLAQPRVTTRSDAGEGSAPLELVGTPEYTSPEQALGQEADERSDLYSLCVVLYELCTGQRPHSGSTVAVLDAKVRVRPESVRRRAPQRGLPAMLDETILRALDQNPNLRFQSAAELRRALEAALREPERRRCRRRRVGFATVGAMAAALAGFGGVAYRKPAVRVRAEAMLEPLVHRFVALGGASRQAPTSVAVTPPAMVAQRTATPPAAKLAATPAAAPEPSVTELPATPAPTATAPNDDAHASSLSDDAAAELERAQQLVSRGNVFKGFDEIRALAKAHDQNPAVLAAWSKAAQHVKAWGEAMRAAQKWAAVDSSPAAALNLARMQRAMGRQPAAIATLQNLLKHDPSSNQARQMLQNLGGERRVAEN